MRQHPSAAVCCDTGLVGHLRTNGPTHLSQDPCKVEDGVDEAEILVGPKVLIDHKQDLPSRKQFAVLLEECVLGIVDSPHQISCHSRREGCGQLSVEGGEAFARVGKVLKFTLFLDH